MGKQSSKFTTIFNPSQERLLHVCHKLHIPLNMVVSQSLVSSTISWLCDVTTGY